MGFSCINVSCGSCGSQKLGWKLVGNIDDAERLRVSITKQRANSLDYYRIRQGLGVMAQDAVFLWHALTVRRREGIFPFPLGDLEGESFLDVPYSRSTNWCQSRC